MTDIRTVKSNMTCQILKQQKITYQIFEQRNQTWCARYLNNKIKDDVPDIRTIKLNMARQIFEQQKMTYVPDIRTTKSNMTCQTFKQLNEP